jgi:transposase InsO family protein
MKDRATAQEIAAAALPGIPKTEKGVLNMAAREGWTKFPRAGQGGGFEYAIASLPVQARVAWLERSIPSTAERSAGPTLPDAPAVEERLPAAEDRRFQAKAMLLGLLLSWRREKGIGKIASYQLMVEAWRAAPELLGIEGWAVEVISACCPKGLCVETLRRWEVAHGRGDFRRVAGRYGGRKGTGVIETAEGGRLRATIIEMTARNPHLTTRHIRTVLRREFGERVEYRGRQVDMPSRHAIAAFLARFRAENRALWARMTDPDRFRSHFQPAFGAGGEGVDRLNQLWEIDASPADVLTTDGRHSIYAVIDVWSRRLMVLVTRTPSAAAAMALLRRAMLAWGVPEILRIDNGSDFISHAFQDALRGLAIEVDICPPYTPEAKGFVERAIGTMQRGLMPILPGFVGHSVADRKQIEARKSFAQRLGESDAEAFCVELTAAELQTAIDRWVVDDYERARHEGIGTSPFERAASWRGALRRIENERALDILLSPATSDGMRTVTRKGIRLENASFIAPELALHINQQVFVRLDAADMGRIFVFSEDKTAFICTAQAPERLGISRAEAAAKAKALQRQYLAEQRDISRREAKRFTAAKVAESYLDQARADAGSNVAVFPLPIVAHSTPAMAAAAEAAGAAPARGAAPAERQPTGHEIMMADIAAWQARAREIMRRWHAGEEVDVRDRKWVMAVVTAYWFPPECAPPDDFAPMPREVVPATE